jgi:tRNA-2-methylthio-N6-dimethylallyladenosine synthase
MVVIFPKGNHQKGDYVTVLIDDCSPATLKGNVINE